MNSKEYVDEVRPALRLLISVLLCVGKVGEIDVDSVGDAWGSSEMFLNHFEKQFKFED